MSEPGQNGNGASEVITFYSYKGGTGRTLALANVACLLAQQHTTEKVLMVDWDLEAPGLHRYFRNQIRSSLLGSWNTERAIDDHEGLLDLFVEVDRQSRDSNLGEGDAAAQAVEKIYDQIKFEKYILQTHIPGLHLMKAGRFDNSYPTTVNTFDWAELHSRSEWLIRLLADKLKERYRYILIDSRTGITDTSGICTTLLPDKLVVVFTPNRQSLTGIRDLVQSATDYRRQSGDVRPLLVFPLASRVESSRASLRERWRFARHDSDIPGYQPLFEDLLKTVYSLQNCDLQKYFDEVQIQHEADYAYGEEIAVLTESKSSDRFSMTRSFETFGHWLQSQSAPWDELDATRRKTVGASLRHMLWRVRGLVWANKKTVGILSGLLAVVGIYAGMASSSRNESLKEAVRWETDYRLLSERSKEEQVKLAQAAATALKEAETYKALLGDSTNVLAHFQAEAHRNLRERNELLTRLKEIENRFAASEADKTNIEAAARSLQDQLDSVKAQLEASKNQLGWKKIVSKSLASLPRGSSGGRPSLPIGGTGFLWPLRISHNSVDFIIDRAPPKDEPPKDPLLRARLSVGESTNFVSGFTEYKVTLEQILVSDAPGKADVKQTAPKPSGALFSVDERSTRVKVP